MIAPWILAAATALWFGLMARRAARAWTLWGLGGGVFGLVTATIVWGVGESASIPFSEHDLELFHIKWTIIAVILIGVLGWLLTLGLHQQHLAIWRAFSKDEQLLAQQGPPRNPVPP
jgi:hypothetical protein